MTSTIDWQMPTPVRVVSHEVDGLGLTLRLDDGLLRLTPRTPRTVRIRYTLSDEFSSKPSLMVLPEPADPASLRFRVQDRGAQLVMSTDALSIEIDRETAAFTYRDAAGGILTKEPNQGGKTLEPIDVEVSVFDDATAVLSDKHIDGLRMELAGVRQVVDRQAYHTRVEFEWADGEALYGLGSHEEGLFDLRGHRQHLYQHNMKVAVPVLLSSRGYGVLFDCTSLMTFHDDDIGSFVWSDVDEELDYYFVVGPEFDDIIGELRHLTGQAPMFPRWAFGYIQSKERYATQAELLEVAREYRARRLPLDCVVLDWKSWTGELWGQKTLDPERFPDPDAMTRELHQLDVRLMVSIWPAMRPGGQDWREFSEAGQLLGNGATYDAFDPQARARYWSQAERGLFSHGVDAWWTDCTEPFEADWAGAVKPNPEERMRINTSEAKRYIDPEIINAYSLLHSEGIYTGQRSTSSTKRVLNLTRSGYPGQQRYGTVVWSGDVTATWETLRRQIAEGLNFCATGMPYWTSDIGAFFVANRDDAWFWSGDFDAGVDDLGYRELYLRWFQYGAWLPMFRAHGTDTPRELWRFGEPGEPVYDGLVTALEFRYRLLPYIYSLAGWTTQRAYTMLRSLLFDFRHDAAVRDVADQFMLGPAFMACPVHEPMAYGPGSSPLSGVPRKRGVYLPAGCDWYGLWTDQRFAGGVRFDADAPLERIPVFVRAGSIVPMGPVRQHANDLPDAPLEIHVYPGRDGAFSLYEDDGDGHAYEAGAFSTVELEWVDAERRLTIGERRGEFPGMLREQELVLVLHADTTATRHLTYRGGAVTIEW
jgi:alpha-D-xyloside xylohydrolase